MASLGERRLAEEFDLALDRAADRRPRSAPAAAPTTTLVAVAHRLGDADRALPGMDEAFRAQLRERLVRLTPELAAAPVRLPAQRGGRHAGLRRSAGAHSDARPGALRRPRPTGAVAAGAGGSEESSSRTVGLSAAWRRRLLAAGVGVAVATGSVGGIAVASAGAQPGDPLYSAKKMFESIQLELSGSPTDRGRQYLKQADIRLSEIDNLLNRPDADVAGSPTAAYLAAALGDLRTAIGDGGTLLLGQVRDHGDQDALHALSDFLQTERQRVDDLTWRLPTALQGQPAQIVALMDDFYSKLQQAAANLPRGNAAGAAPTPGHQHGGNGGSGGTGTQGGPTASHGGAGSTGKDTSSGHATGEASAHGSSSASGASPSASGTGSATPSPSSSAITINLLPLPILPSTSIDLPPLLGLPGINIGLGGGSSPSPTE